MEDEWFCPAVKAHGLCWKYFFAGRGGPTDTSDKLREWIKRTGAFKDLDEFQAVCEACEDVKPLFSLGTSAIARTHQCKLART